MQSELIDEAAFKKIVSNQNLITQDLDKSYTAMHSFLQLSNKYLPQAINSFKIGEEHITKIRANLDYIHKIMMKIKKKIKAQKEQEKIKSQQINTVVQAMKNVMDEENKDNFLQTNGKSQQKIETNKEQVSEKLSNTLQVDQIQKLMAYYKLDETENHNQRKRQQFQQTVKVNSFNQSSPFVLLSKKQKKKQQAKNEFQESLI